MIDNISIFFNENNCYNNIRTKKMEKYKIRKVLGDGTFGTVF